MRLAELRTLLSSLPAQYDNFSLVSLRDMTARANGFSAANVPINHIALDLERGEVLLVDDKQASIMKVVGKVPSQAL